MPTPTSDDDPRFTDEELALILHRAAERELRAPLPAADGRSLAEIQAIAAEAGIDPAHVAREAAALRTERSAVVGGMQDRTHFAFELTVPGELPEAERLALLDRARALTRMRGSVKQEPDALTWTGTDGFGVTRVSLPARPGRTTIVVSEDRTSSAIAAGFGAALLGVGVAVVAVPLLLIAGFGGAPGVVAIGALLAGGATWAGMRLRARRRAAAWRARAQWLGEELERAAREALGRNV